MIKKLPTKHKKILKLSIPAAVNSLLDMLQVITDLIMVGRISAFSVAAVGLGVQTLMFLYAFVTLLHVGTSSLLSRFVGANTTTRASTALSTLLIFAFYLSIGFMVIWYFGASYLYVAFGTVDEVIELGTQYVHMLTWMLPFVFMKLVFVTALNSAGDTRTPMNVKLFSILLNIFLNYIFIFGHFGAPAMGVEGAALGTVIVNILEFLVYLYLYVNRTTIYIPVFHYSTKLLKRALKVGIPSSFERTLTYGSFMIFTAIIAHHGTEVIAGYQIGLRIEGIAYMPGVGFTIAAMALVGQGLGAKDPERASDDVVLVLKYTSGFMFFLSFFMIFMPEKLVWLFTDDNETIKEASLYLRIVGISQVPLAFNFVLSGALRGAGDSRRTLKINLISLWFVRIIPALTLSYYFNDIMFVYIAMISDTFVKAIWLWMAFTKGEWKNIKV